MAIFIELFTKLLPLYLLIFLGYISGKKLNAQKETLAPLLIYIITPVIIFDGTFQASLNRNLLLLPIIIFLMCTIFCILSYWLGLRLWNNSTANIFAYSAGSGNTGYFGLPVALMLFGNEIFSTYIIAIFGMTLFENTIGFFITAKNNRSFKKSILKVFQLPTLYAFILGLIINVIGINTNETYQVLANNFRGTYSIIGMMLIGIALSKFKKGNIDLTFISLTFINKFVMWPIITFGLISIDKVYFQLFSTVIHQILLLIAIVTLAANSVAIATEFNTQPQKASITVLWSTFFALIYIPTFISLFF